MNKFFSKTFTKQCNDCYETQNWLVNGFQNFWIWNISWNVLHKPWHNSIDKKIKVLKHFFEYFCENIPRNIFPKVVLWVGKCGSCYLVGTETLFSFTSILQEFAKKKLLKNFTIWWCVSHYVWCVV
jgi:hypothetical protein